MKIPAGFAITHSAVLACLSLNGNVGMVRSGLVLTENVMRLAKEAARLSILSYDERPPDDTVTHDYAAFGYFDDEPDQALTARTVDGYCFAAFRGTSLTVDDWSQNLQIGESEVCADGGGGRGRACCSSRVGFYDAYDTTYRAAVEGSIRDCARSCPNRDECVVLTGHSQGGAVAAVAAVVLADLNPTVITFGQPPTVDAPCPLLNGERIYRFVNTKATAVGIAYDPVPMAPGLGADHFGNMIILSDDPTGVAFIGLDANEYFHPFLNGVEAHYMRAGAAVNGTAYPGYADRIDALTGPNTTYPVRNNGFIPGSLCSSDKECESKECGRDLITSWKRCVGTQCDGDDDCDTGRCDSGLCLPKATSCMPCDEDSDCAGESTVCLLYYCSNELGKMDNNCICRTGGDCASGRCEGYNLNPVCEARLSDGGPCNENSDCKSDYCTWSFLCGVAAEGGGAKSFAWLLWLLIGLACLGLALGVAYAVYHCFIKKGKEGYSEVPANEGP